MYEILNANLGKMDKLLTCCKHTPPLAPGTEVINVCPGCDRRYRENYRDSSTISLWEVLAAGDFFPWPDYHGQKMSIIDACPTRDQERVHRAIRVLLDRMNISLVEPKNTRTKSTCCGDSCFGLVPLEKVKEQMIKRAAEMPVEDVVVYCVSCSKAMFTGGKKPRYLVDLLFREETLPGTVDLEQWHKELDEFIASHA